MTFSHEHFVEFCFYCFDNDCNGRDNARDGMLNIQYRNGATHTGQPTQCAFDVMLSQDCDITEFDELRLDIIYVTDGKSNGPQNMCRNVQRLHDLEELGVELTIYNVNELRCITQPQNTDPL